MSVHNLALLTPRDCARMDAQAGPDMLDGLMRNASRAVARAIMARYTPCRVLVACGPGNNGGDGYGVAGLLERAGWSVRVARTEAPKPGTCAARAAQDWHGPLVAFDPEEFVRADLVVDAVFGAGLTRDLPGNISSALAVARRRVAIDVPSGVDGETGCLRGNVAPCELIVTFTRPKPGHLLQPGRDVCGTLLCADIGIPADVLDMVKPSLWRNEPGLWQLPLQSDGDHKYSRGVVSLCGGAEMPGAARLAARAARRVGAGLVRIAAGDAASAYRLGDPGLVVDDAPLSDLLVDGRRRVWICGPGLTPDEVQETLPLLLRHEKSVIADAGALSWAAGNPDRLKDVAAITPHAGEFARLFGSLGDSRIEAVRLAAKALACVVVLKGADTLIAAPDGRVAINNHASPALATAGSGDTLTGVIAALLASGMEVWDACAAGVWIHGEAGIRASEQMGGWPIAEDLDVELGKARKYASELQNAHGRV